MAHMESVRESAYHCLEDFESLTTHNIRINIFGTYRDLFWGVCCYHVLVIFGVGWQNVRFIQLFYFQNSYVG